MTKTSKTKSEPKATKTSKGAKPKRTKPEQLKLAGTGRLDAIEEIETQAEAFLLAREAEAEAHDEMAVEQNKLTEVLKKHKLTEYIYVDRDGVKRLAYIPLEAKAKVKLVKPAKDADGDAE